MKRTAKLERSALLARKRWRPKRHHTTDWDEELKASRPFVHERSGGRCEAGLPGCTGEAEHVHHRQQGRRSWGASNHPLGLLDVCWNCHRTLHRDPPLARRCGLLVSRWEDPVPVPVHPERWAT